MTTGFMSPADRAQAQIDRMMGVNQDGVNTPPAEATPAATPPAEASATPAEPVAPVQTPQEPVAAQADDPNGETYKARWETLKGMYRAATDEKASLQAEVNMLRSQIAGIQNGIQTQQTPAASGNVNELLAQLTDAIGEDVAEPIRQFVQASIANQVSPVAQQVQNVEAETTKTKQQNFELALTGVAPGWREAMGHPDWVIWLNSHREPLSGLTYAECFDRANESWNLNGLATIFKAFAASIAPPPVTPQPEPDRVDPRLALVSPGRTGSASIENEIPQERFFKQSEVNAFYKDAALGKYRGREAEYAAMDTEITKANIAGRIIAG